MKEYIQPDIPPAERMFMAEEAVRAEEKAAKPLSKKEKRKLQSEKAKKERDARHTDNLARSGDIFVNGHFHSDPRIYRKPAPGRHGR